MDGQLVRLAEEPLDPQKGLVVKKFPQRGCVLDKGGVGEALAGAQCSVRINDLQNRFLKLLDQLGGQYLLDHGEPMGVDTGLGGLQLIEAEFIAVRQRGFLDVSVGHRESRWGLWKP